MKKPRGRQATKKDDALVTATKDDALVTATKDDALVTATSWVPSGPTTVFTNKVISEEETKASEILGMA